MGLNGGLRHEKSASNRPSSGTAQTALLSLNMPRGSEKEHERPSGRDLNQQPRTGEATPLGRGVRNFPPRNYRRQSCDVKQEVLGATVQNVTAWVVWLLGFGHPYLRMWRWVIGIEWKVKIAKIFKTSDLLTENRTGDLRNVKQDCREVSAFVCRYCVCSSPPHWFVPRTSWWKSSHVEPTDEWWILMGYIRLQLKQKELCDAALK